ncbi:hypothetical protein BH11PAT1_BH11PAT1_5780 [soil metagenome]
MFSTKQLNKRTSLFIEKFVQFLLDTPVALLIGLEILVGSVLSGFSFILFAKLSDTILDKEKILFDTVITQFIYTFRSPLMTQVMFFITSLGSYFLVAGSIFILLFLLYKKHKNEAILFSLIVLMGAVINIILKVIIQRPRPTFYPLVIVKDFSFPSGHSMDSFVFFITIAYFSYHFTRNKKVSAIIAVLCALLIILIGISRVYLGVHYPSDVLGGYIAGLLWFLTIIVLERTFILFRLFREHEKPTQKK